MNIGKTWHPIIPMDREIARALERAKRERKLGPYAREAMREKLQRDGYIPSTPAK